MIHHKQPDPTPDEVRERQTEGRTRGRKGTRLHVQQFSIQPQSREAVERYSKRWGTSLSQTINLMIQQAAKELDEDAERAKTH